MTRPTLEDVYLELTAEASEEPALDDRSRRRVDGGGVPRRSTEVARLAWRQYRLERKLFWRNPSAAFFNFLLPLLFLAFFGAILHGKQKRPQRHRARASPGWR